MTVTPPPSPAEIAALEASYQQAMRQVEHRVDSLAPPKVAPEDAPAGQYVLTAELFDQPLSEPDEEFRFKRFRRGDTVTLSASEARRLLTAGAVTRTAPARRSEYAAALAAYRRAQDLEAAAARIADHETGDIR